MPSTTRSGMGALAAALLLFGAVASATADDPCEDAGNHASEVAATLTRSLAVSTAPGAFLVERSDDGNGIAFAFDIAHVASGRDVARVRVERDPGSTLATWRGYLTLDITATGSSLALLYDSGGSGCCRCSYRIERLGAGFRALRVGAEASKVSPPSPHVPASGIDGPTSGSCAVANHPLVASLADLLSTSLDPSTRSGIPGDGRFELQALEDQEDGSSLLRVEYLNGGLAARGAFRRQHSDYPGGAYDLVARGGRLAVVWTPANACESRCFFEVVPGPSAFVVRARPRDPGVPCEVHYDRARPSPGPAERVERSHSSRTLTVPGWMDDWQLHLKPLGLQEDYLAAPVRRLLPEERLSSFLWERLLRKTQSAVASLRRQIHAIASDVVGQSEGGASSLHIEAHSWGGVLAFFALRELQEDGDFLDTVFGGDPRGRQESRRLWLHLNTMGSPVGCLESTETESGGVAAAAREALPALAFRRAGLITPQRVALDPSLVTWRNYVVDGDPVACTVASLGRAGAIALRAPSPDYGMIERHSAYWDDDDNLRAVLNEGRIHLLPVAGEAAGAREVGAAGTPYSWGGPGWGLVMSLPAGWDHGEHGRGASFEGPSPAPGRPRPSFNLLLLEANECDLAGQPRRLGAYSFVVARDFRAVRYTHRLPGGRCHAFFARSTEAARSLEHSLLSYTPLAGLDRGHVPD